MPVGHELYLVVGGQSLRPLPGKEMVAPFCLSCIVAASALETLVGLGPYLNPNKLTMLWHIRTNNIFKNSFCF